MSLELLNEGGAAGHMNHLYDNGDLTFKEMKEIFALAAAGKLEGTEKTDGQNLMISYSVEDGRAKGVRNKGEIKSGGLTPEQLAAKFADRANPALKETFKDALSAFERAIDGLSHEEQVELFGPDTSIYYNAEVMDPRTPNVINYDTKTLVIHRAGHGQFNRETGEKLAGDLSAKAAKLEEIIKSAQERMRSEEYGVQVNAIRRLQALSDQAPLNAANSAISRIISSVNYLIGNRELQISEDSTISDFMIARVYVLINSLLQRQQSTIGVVDPVAKMNITKRILGVEGIRIVDLVKKLTPEQKTYVKENLLSKEAMTSMLKSAIHPLEMVVSNFATEMLRGLHSAFILDNEKEAARLRDEVKGAITAIQGSGSEDAMGILTQQLKKLKSADNVSATAEGFVFDYNGVTYKFTGNFAPVNQILGLFKYGRGKVPPIKKETLQEAKSGLADVAVVPGAFKPPHKGHLEMIKTYSSMAKRVVVMISPLPRTLPDGRAVTFEQSKALFDMFLKKMGISNVTVIQSPKNSPVGACFDFVANEDDNPDYAQSGETVILGTSTKGGDESRFSADANKYAKKGVKVKIVPVDPTENLSATNMRKAIAERNISALTLYIPDEFGKERKKVAQDIIATMEDDSITESVIYDILFETIRKKGSKYCLVSEKSKKNLGCYSSKKGAEKREKQVNYFKHLKKEETNVGAIEGAPRRKEE